MSVAVLATFDEGLRRKHPILFLRQRQAAARGVYVFIGSFDFSGTPLFEDVSFSIDPGDRVGLIGANGAGKTTFLRVLAGELDLSRGSVTRRRGLQFAALEQDSPTVELSGGEQARERLSRVFAADADLLVLDEPTNHLEGRRCSFAARARRRGRCSAA